MRCALASLLCLLSGLSGCGKALPSPELSAFGDAALEAPCSGRKHCVTVYVTPWCSACRAVVPLLQPLRARAVATDSVGLKIIVGGAGRAAIEGMARQIGGRVYLDELDDFARSASVRSVPHWWVTDSKGRVKRDFAGAYAGAPADALVISLMRRLEIDNLFRAAPVSAASEGKSLTFIEPSKSAPRVAPPEECGKAKDSSACRTCCSGLGRAGYVWVHGRGCRCVGK